VRVIMVAHDVNPILPYLDRVVYLARGAAVSGHPSRWSPAEQLSALYGNPIDVLRDRTGRLFVVGQPDVPAGLPTETTGEPNTDLDLIADVQQMLAYPLMVNARAQHRGGHRRRVVAG